MQGVETQLGVTRGGATASRAESGLCAAPELGRFSNRRDWLSLLLCAIEATGASPAGLTSGQRGVAVAPVDVVAAALASLAAQGIVPRHILGDGAAGSVEVHHLDAAAFGIAPRRLSDLLDEIEAARGAAAPPLQRELPYPAWRRLVAAAGAPASLALAMLPPEGRGGALRLPSGARRRLREIGRARPSEHFGA